MSALALSFVGFGGLAGLLGGWIGDRVSQRNLLIGGLLAMSVTGILIYQVQASLGWQCLFAFLMGVFGTGVMFPNLNSAIQRAVRPNQVGRAAGLFVTSYYGSAAFSGLLFARSSPDSAGARRACGRSRCCRWSASPPWRSSAPPSSTTPSGSRLIEQLVSHPTRRTLTRSRHSCPAAWPLTWPPGATPRHSLPPRREEPHSRGTT